MTSIALLGDSVLDNFYWLENPSRDLTVILRERGYDSNNFAVDETRLNEIMVGRYVIPRYKEARPYPYPEDIDGKVYPLKLLKMIPDTLDKVALLSVGGNDMRHYIPSMLFGGNFYLKAVLSTTFVQRYRTLIESILQTHPRLILIMPYVPCTAAGSMYGYLISMLNTVYGGFQQFIYGLAKEYNLPVFDLSRTFDHTVRSHYGSTDIEPGDYTVEIMADGIDYILKHYKGNTTYYNRKCVQGWKQEKIELSPNYQP
jgi:hypothetical protein